MQGGYDPKKDLGATIRLLGNVLDKTTQLVQHLDTQTNILIGISLSIFAFSLTQYHTSNVKLVLAVMALFSACAAIVALFAIHPPRFMRKKGQQESIMYNGRISKFPTAAAYERELKRIIGHSDAIEHQYAQEIYNLATFYYRPKRELFKLSRSILLCGVIVASITFFVITQIPV